MDWLEFFGRYLLPLAVVIILAQSGIMKARYSLAAWIGIIVVDYLSILIPVPAAMWPPTLLFGVAFLGYALEAGAIVFLLFFVIWRSERRKWREQYPICYVVGQDAWPALKREPPRQFCTFIRALASKS